MLNRLWTFHDRRGHVGVQGMRFFVVSLACARREPARAARPDHARRRQARRPGDRDRARHAAELHRQQALVVPPSAERRASLVRRLSPSSARCARRAGARAAATTARHGTRLRRPGPPRSRRRSRRRADARIRRRQHVLAVFERDPKVRDWLARYPMKGRVDEETYDPSDASWTVKIWWGKAGEIAEGDGRRRERRRHRGVDRPAGRVEDGARLQGRVRRRQDQQPVDLGRVLRRLPRRARRLPAAALAAEPRPDHAALADGVALVLQPRRTSSRRCRSSIRRCSGSSCAASGSAPPAAARPRARCGRRGSCSRATVFLAGFRIGLNVQASNVIDVGYSGVIGAERIVNGEAPWGNFPIEGDLKACGPADAAGEIRERIQTNGRCESANPQGDTYGPVAYESYIPGYLAPRLEREVGRAPRRALHVDRLRPPVHDRPLARRPALRRRPARARRSRSPGPHIRSRSTRRTRTRTTRSCRASSSAASGSSSRPSGAARSARSRRSTKFASLIVAPLWLTYPGGGRAAFARRLRAGDARRVLRRPPRAEPAARAARLLGPHRRAGRSGATRPSRSGTGGSTTRAASPICTSCSACSRRCSSSARSPPPFFPRRKSPLQLAALTAALLAGFELVLTYWLYTYIPWFFGFAAIALLRAARRRARAPVGRAC